MRCRYLWLTAMMYQTSRFSGTWLSSVSASANAAANSPFCRRARRRSTSASTREVGRFVTSCTRRVPPIVCVLRTRPDSHYARRALFCETPGVSRRFQALRMPNCDPPMRKLDARAGVSQECSGPSRAGKPGARSGVPTASSRSFTIMDDQAAPAIACATLDERLLHQRRQPHRHPETARELERESRILAREIHCKANVIAAVQDHLALGLVDEAVARACGDRLECGSASRRRPWRTASGPRRPRSDG